MTHKDYDGNQPSSWDVGVWVPKAVRNRQTMKKIRALQVLRYEITASQRQQLRHRGYNV